MNKPIELTSAQLRKMVNALTKDFESCQDNMTSIKEKLENLNSQMQVANEDWYNSPLEDEIDTFQYRIEDFEEFLSKFYDLRERICGSEGLPNA